MAQCRPRQHTSNNRNAKRMGNGVIAHQDACLRRSRGLQGETDQKGNRKATVALARWRKALSELYGIEASLEQGYCRELFLAACAKRQEVRDAEAELNSYR